jgi:hypothetical protein
MLSLFTERSLEVFTIACKEKAAGQLIQKAKQARKIVSAWG